ncbi:MAG: uroporphyrinogen-III synthase [Duodenibacillus sp.]
MATTHQPVILMRPGAANDRLADVLKADGIDSWRWPAFTITLPEDEAPVAQRFANLDDVDMVVMASPAAVAAVAHWVQKWPGHVQLATVGEGTARVIRAAWGDDVEVVCPKGDAASSGSEALFEMLKNTQIPRRVLIARGQTGREWLSEQLTAMGADVEKISAYVRVPIELTPEQIADLSAAVHGPSPIVYVTSTDAVAALLHAVKPVPEARDWLTRGTAVTIHPRCAARLAEAGFMSIDITGARDEQVREVVLKHLC